MDLPALVVLGSTTGTSSCQCPCSPHTYYSATRGSKIKKSLPGLKADADTARVLISPCLCGSVRNRFLIRAFTRPNSFDVKRVPGVPLVASAIHCVELASESETRRSRTNIPMRHYFLKTRIAFLFAPCIIDSVTFLVVFLSSPGGRRSWNRFGELGTLRDLTDSAEKT